MLYLSGTCQHISEVCGSGDHRSVDNCDILRSLDRNIHPNDSASTAPRRRCTMSSGQQRVYSRHRVVIVEANSWRTSRLSLPPTSVYQYDCTRWFQLVTNIHTNQIRNSSHLCWSWRARRQTYKTVQVLPCVIQYYLLPELGDNDYPNCPQRRYWRVPVREELVLPHHHHHHHVRLF